MELMRLSGRRCAHVNLAFDCSCADSSVSSGTTPHNGCVRYLRLRTVDDWGTHIFQSDDFFWYALTLQLAALFHPAVLTCLIFRTPPHRSSCILGHSGHSKEIREDQTPGNTQHLGRHCPRLDQILPTHVLRPPFCPTVPIPCPGKRYTIRSLTELVLIGCVSSGGNLDLTGIVSSLSLLRRSALRVT